MIYVMQCIPYPFWLKTFCSSRTSLCIGVLVAMSSLLLLPPDGPVSGVESGGLLLLPPDDEPAGELIGGRRPRRRAPSPARSGSLGVWIVEKGLYEPASGSSAAPVRLTGAAERQRVVGLGVLSWEFVAAPAPVPASGEVVSSSRLLYMVAEFMQSVQMHVARCYVQLFFA